MSQHDVDTAKMACDKDQKAYEQDQATLQAAKATAEKELDTDKASIDSAQAAVNDKSSELALEDKKKKLQFLYRNSKSVKSNTAKDTDLMTMEKINTLQDDFSDKIEAISLSENGSSGKVKSDTSFANVSTVGTNDGYQDVKSLEITSGRYLSQKDIDQNKQHYKT